MADLTHRVALVELTPQPTFTQRAFVAPGDLGRRLGEILPAVWKRLLELGIEPTGAPFTRYLGMTDVFTIEAGLPVAQPVPGDDRFVASELPGGPAAVTIHVGHYDRIGAAHDAVFLWAEANGRTPAGGSWESYLTDPSEESDPARWQTRVVLPLKP